LRLLLRSAHRDVAGLAPACSVRWAGLELQSPTVLTAADDAAGHGFFTLLSSTSPTRSLTGSGRDRSARSLRRSVAHVSPSFSSRSAISASRALNRSRSDLLAPTCGPTMSVGIGETILLAGRN